MNTFTPNLQAYGRIWLQALAHLGQVAVNAIRAARVMAAYLHVPSADAYKTVKIPVQVCNLRVVEHDNSNRRPFLVEVLGLLCTPALLNFISLYQEPDQSVKPFSHSPTSFVFFKIANSLL